MRARTTTERAPSTGPLAGVRILDLSQVEVGPCATQLLGDFGADVLKVERPGRGDLLRHVDPYAGGDVEASAYFFALNRNKRSVMIDFQSAAGRDRIYRLLAESDVLVENFRPGTLEKHGLGYDDLKDRFPRLVYASATGFGPRGPLAGLGGQDLLAQAVSGMAMHNRTAEGHPRLDSVPVGDYSTGVLLAAGVLLALLSRASTGAGQHVEVNLVDTLLAMQTQELTQWLMRGRETNFLTDFVAGTYQCQDGWVVIAGYWVNRPLRALCDTFELTASAARLAELADAPEQARALVESELAAALRALPVERATAMFRGAGFLCAECLDYENVVGHPQMKYNESFLDVVVGDQTMRTVACPIKLSATPATLRLPPPKLGSADAPDKT